MRAGVLGGTFDPPHLAHLVLAAAAHHALNLDRVLFMPAGLPWRKAGREITAAHQRVEMVRAAIAGLPWAEVSTLEVDRGGPSYTVDTMRTLGAAGGDWWFILGADALADLPNWHEAHALVKAARLAVAMRPPAELIVPWGLAGSSPFLSIDVVQMVALDISSSDLRARVHDGRPTDVVLPMSVREVIDAARLYSDG